MTDSSTSLQARGEELPRRKGWRWHLPAASLLVFLSVLTTWPAVIPRRELLLTSFDTYGFLWNMWWTKFSLLDLHQSPFWSDYIFAPNGASLALHSLCLPYGILSIPFQLLMGSLDGCVVAMRELIFLSVASSAVLMYFFAHEVTGSRPGAFAAAVIFAFLPFRMLHLHHPHIVCTEFVVLFGWLFWRLLAKPKLLRAVATGAAFALLLYASLEYALFMALFAIVGAAWVLWRNRKEAKRIVAMGAVAVAVALLLGLPLLLAAAKESSHMAEVGPDDLAELREGLMSELMDHHGALLSPFYPNTAHPLRRYISRPERYNEGALSLVAIGLALLGSLFGPRRKKGIWLLLAGLFFVLWLGPYLKLTQSSENGFPLPYLFLHKVVPLFGWGGDTQRFMPIWTLCLALLAAFGLDWLFRWMRERPKLRLCAWPAAVFVSLLICFEQLVAPVPFASHPVSQCYGDMAADPEQAAVWTLTPGDMGSLLFQVVHQKPILTRIPFYFPRQGHAPHAMDLFKGNSALLAFIHPDQFFGLDSGDQAAVIESNRDAFRRMGLKYIVVDRAPSLIQNGALQRVPPDRPLVLKQIELLERHKPAAIRRYPTATVFQMF